MTTTTERGLDKLDHQRKLDHQGKLDQRGPKGKIRADVEGLRAVATFLVLPYHAGLMWFPGGFVGVDVFFVISGFVITGQLLKEVHRDGRVSLMKFYARRAKRLLPASSVVLIATAVMVWLWVPKIRWEVTGGDIVGSALYFVNWRLADRSVDYLQEDVTPSAVQQYWSLAVEEQFYFVWPILLLAAVLIATRFGIKLKAALWGGLAIVAVPSFAWAVHQSFFEPERAYFVTTTRMWEFAIGAAVAIGAASFDKMPRKLAVLLGWGGLAMILVAGRIYSTDIHWPGYYAALPTVGTAFVIAAGVAAGRFGPIALIGNRFMGFIGYLTYSLYLWHWPLLIVAREHSIANGGDGISVQVGLLIIVATVIPAYLTYHLIENPFRHSWTVSRYPKVALSLGVNFSLLGVVAGLALLVGVGSSTSAAPTVSGPGAAILSASPTQDPAGRPADKVSGGITPDPLKAPEDVPDLYDQGCQVDVNSDEAVACTYGPKDARTTVAVVGDSKAGQWMPAFQLLAEKYDWRLVSYTKSSCQFATVGTALNGDVYQTCRDWTDNVLDKLTGPDKPDFVVTAGQRKQGVVGGEDGDLDLSEDAMQAAMVDTWQRIRDAGVKVAVLADTPQTGGDIYACVSENRDSLDECTYERARGVKSSGAGVQAAAAKEAGVPFIDLIDYICPTAECAPVIGNVLVYRQGSHITKTYIETLTPRLESALARAGIE